MLARSWHFVVVSVEVERRGGDMRYVGGAMLEEL